MEGKFKSDNMEYQPLIFHRYLLLNTSISILTLIEN